VARTKFLAKVASAVAKPNGLLVVPPERELTFLHPLPVERLWGVGRVTAEKLHSRGITRVGQVAHLAEPALVAIVGRASGRHLYALAHNRDPRPVTVGRRRRSIGSQRALGRRPRSQEELELTLIAIADRLGRRLRAAHRLCRTVVLRLRFGDYSRATRSHTLPDPTGRTHEILHTARGLFTVSAPLIEERGLTLIGLSLTNLEEEVPLQLPLPLTRRRDAALDAALDVIRDRFGSTAVTRAVLLGRDAGFEMPVLPD
jgi:DNA polymerase-4